MPVRPLPAALILTAVVTVSLLLGEPALAAGGADGGEHHAIDTKKLAFQFLNFGVLLFILIKFGGSAINKALKARYEQMKVSLEDASRGKAEAEARLKLQETRLQNLEGEVVRLREAIRLEAEHEQRKLVEAAEERAARIKAETTFLLDQQVKEAELRFRAEVATAAVRIAEEIVKKSLLVDDEQRLAQTFVAELERPTVPAAPALPRRPQAQETI